MKLKTALEIGKDCGLEDVGEAICNIRMHAGSIFLYEEEQKEYDELCEDFYKSGFSVDDKIDKCLGDLL